jgi:c-di-GMP-binding flagellar brake protein YcgR
MVEAGLCAQTPGIPERFIEAAPGSFDLVPYQLSDAWEIASALRALLLRAEWLTVYSSALDTPCWAQVTALDAESGSFSFATERALPFCDEALLFVAEQQGVKLQFEARRRAGSLAEGRYDAAIPAVLVRIQRRRFVRIETPLGLPFLALFKLAGRSLEMGVDNLGLGGVALRAMPSDARLFYVGRKLPRVWLELGQDEAVRVDLEVRSCRPWSSFLLGEQYLIGCRFLDHDEAVRDSVRQALAGLSGNELSLSGSGK